MGSNRQSGVSLVQLVNLSSAVLTIVVNILSELLPLNGVSTATISNKYYTLFTPAGYVFSIWGVIYILLILFGVFQVQSRNRDQPFLQKIGYLFALASLANIVWLFLWHYEMIVVSLVVMYTLLVSLVLIYVRLGIGKESVDRRVKLLVHVPFSVYTGWITVASIANTASALVSVGWNGFGISPVTWAVVVILVAALVTELIIIRRRDVAYSLVIIWALAGIMVAQSLFQTIVITCGVAILLIGAALLLTRNVRFRS